MEYYETEEWFSKTMEIIDVLELDYIDKSRLGVILSTGSKSNAIARIHSIGIALQFGLKIPSGYVIELIIEKFNRQSEEEKIKTIIHELLHIPKKFKGGFVHHGKYHNSRKINKFYQLYLERKNNSSF